MLMKAALLVEQGRPYPLEASAPLVIERVELSEPGPGEILVRIKATGLCHSDLSNIEGARIRPMPVLLGHEASGIVEQLGNGVTDLAVGDHVILSTVCPCGRCLACAEGFPNRCDVSTSAGRAGTLLSGARRLRYHDADVQHFTGVSSFAEFAVVARQSATRIDDDIPFDVASLFGCAVVTGVGAVINAGGVRPGMNVAVVGLGGVGLAAVLGALAAGAARVIAVDRAADKVTFATSVGATHGYVTQGADDAREIGAILPNIDVAIEAAGHGTSAQLATGIVRRGGTTVLCGLPRPEDTFPLAPMPLVFDERRIVGSFMGSAVPARDFPRYLDLYRLGRLPVQKLLTHRLALAEINTGFDRLHNGAAIRQIIAFGD